MRNGGGNEMHCVDREPDQIIQSVYDVVVKEDGEAQIERIRSS